jgi:hypothetical protein
MTLKALCLGAVAAAAVAAPALAHHSFAMFDNDKTVSLQGTVKEFEWTNPHAWMDVVVETNGSSQEWAFEMASPLQLVSHGWKKDTVKPGDKVTIQAHPLKDGTHGGSYVSITLPTGQILGQQRPVGG